MSDFLKIVNDWLPSIGIIVSALLSFFIARAKSKSEIKKIMLNFSRENELAAKNAYSEFMSATANYCNYGNNIHRGNAVKATALYMSYAPSNIILLLKEMDVALSNEDKKTIKKLRDEILELYPMKM